MIDDEINSVLNCCAVNVPSTVKFCGNRKLALENVVPVTAFSCTCAELEIVPVGSNAVTCVDEETMPEGIPVRLV